MGAVNSVGPPLSLLHRLDRGLRGGSRTLLSALILFLIATVGYLDFVTGVDISFSIFYLVPVSLAAWYLGRLPGQMAAALSASVWLGMDLIGRHISLPAWAPYWNAAVRFGFFLITALLLHRLRTTLEEESRMARSDPLTGVLNGRAFEENARQLMALAQRGGMPLTIAYVDVDD